MSEFYYTDLTGLNSEALDLVAYNDNDNTMLVRFNSGGNYFYTDVDRDTFNGFDVAASARRYWSTNVSGVFRSERWDDATELVSVPADAHAEEPAVAEVTPTATRDTYALSGYLTTASTIVVTPARFGVTYDLEVVSNNGVIKNPPFESVFNATNEHEALRLFHASIVGMERLTGWTFTTKVKSVTHYFD